MQILGKNQYRLTMKTYSEKVAILDLWLDTEIEKQDGSDREESKKLRFELIKEDKLNRKYY
jgi:hypothetical protein